MRAITIASLATGAAVMCSAALAQPAPTVNASPNQGIAPLTVYFSAQNFPQQAPESSFTWQFGDQTSAVGRQPIHEYKNAGAYEVTFTYKPSLGPIITHVPPPIPPWKLKITVAPPPPQLAVYPTALSFNFQSGDTTVQLRSFTIRNVGGRPLQWAIQHSAPLAVSQIRGPPLGPGQSIDIQVTASASGIRSANLRLPITVSSDAINGPIIVMAQLTVTPSSHVKVAPVIGGSLLALTGNPANPKEATPILVRQCQDNRKADDSYRNAAGQITAQS